MEAYLLGSNGQFTFSSSSQWTNKDKWGSLYRDYKKKHDYQNVTGHNEKYQNMSVKYKVSQGF
jgi:hypothetical protein